MKGAAGVVVAARFLQADALIYNIYDIYSGEQIVNEMLGNLASHTAYYTPANGVMVRREACSVHRRALFLKNPKARPFWQPARQTCRLNVCRAGGLATGAIMQPGPG